MSAANVIPRSNLFERGADGDDEATDEVEEQDSHVDALVGAVRGIEAWNPFAAQRNSRE